MSDPELEAAKKLDAYERAEALPEKFHVWGLVLNRIKDAPKKASADAPDRRQLASPPEPQAPQVEGQDVP